MHTNEHESAEFFTEGNQGNEGDIFQPLIDADVLIVEHV
jgi:hypothetical protein